MNDSEGHNYFFAMPKIPWKESKMALLDRETAERLDLIESRLENIERALEALLGWQEEMEDGEIDAKGAEEN